MKVYRVFAFVFTSVATGLAAAFIVLVLHPDLLSEGAGQPPPAAPVPALSRSGGEVSYADAVARAAPSVVNVFATKITRRVEHPMLNDPLLKQLFGHWAEQPRFRRQNSLGSGVIVDNNGHILTNNHVIEGASEIQVVLRDGRQLPARVVGTDPETDLAVLQVAGDKLPVATLGNARSLRVGDVVLAIGNPYGVGQTVTLGIVSATGRTQLGISDFEDFIQTDAAINPGNSGGALINTLGQVVGINTAIFSNTGSSSGIGFAIPVELADQVLKQIEKYGRVIRGWIGVSTQELTPALARSFHLHSDQGLLVSGVLRGGPADQAGLVPGDLILAVDGQIAHSSAQMLNLVAGKHPGDKLNVDIERGSQQQQLQVTVAERPAKADAR